MIDANKIQEIKSLISQGNLSEALAILVEEGEKSADYYDSIIQISGRYNALDKNYSKGTLTKTDYNLELNQIRKYVLDVLSTIDETLKKKTDSPQISEESTSRDNPSNHIVNLISNEKVDEAVEELRSWIGEEFQNSDFRTEATIIFSRYSRLKMDNASGIISSSDFRVEFASIKNSILNLVNKIIETPKKEKEEKEKQEQIELSAASFVQESISALSKREKILKIQAITWYIIGFLSLMSGVWIAVQYINFNTIDTDSIVKIVYQVIKSLVVIGLLIAASRYAFNLGKTYMNESLKNADRIHAISFGKFYLQVFGTNIKSEDLKDVFKDWNTSQESPFTKLDPNDFDPKMLETVVKIIEAVKKSE